MNELEAFANEGCLWYRLESCKAGYLYKTQKEFWIGNSRSYTNPVYQVFNKDGKRVYSSMSAYNAYRYYERMAADE